MAYTRQIRGTRVLKVKDAATGEVIFPVVLQTDLPDLLGFTATDIKNIPHQLSGKQKQVKGYAFDLLGTMVKA